MTVHFPINLANKVRKMKQMPDLTPETLDLLQSSRLTKRVCLGITNTFIYFIGIACPFVLRYKTLMKQLFQSKSKGWNEEIDGKQ